MFTDIISYVLHTVCLHVALLHLLYIIVLIRYNYFQPLLFATLPWFHEESQVLVAAGA